jgi:hypothetical protein
MLPNQQSLSPPRLRVAAEAPSQSHRIEVSLAELRLLERIRSCQHATMFMVHVGGDGEPKMLFAYEDVKREDLAR